MTTFGYSITGRTDLDENGYPGDIQLTIQNVIGFQFPIVIF